MEEPIHTSSFSLKPEVGPWPDVWLEHDLMSQDSLDAEQMTRPTGASLKRERPQTDTLSGQPDSPETYEQAHVHEVYDAIASHFSATRYKAWPRVREFLEGLPPYTLIADVGCGNGKYFGCAQRRMDSVGGDEKAVPTHRYVVGLDHSGPLLRLTQRMWVDPNVVDGAVPSASACRTGHTPTCSTAPRRAVTSEALPRTDVVRCDARRTPLRRGLFDAAISIAVIHHYATHARRVGALRELLELVRPEGGQVLVYVWAMEQTHKASRAVDAVTGDGLVQWKMHENFSEEKRDFLRYYHFFRKEELEQLCVEASEQGGLRCSVREIYWDKENWCLRVERTG